MAQHHVHLGKAGMFWQMAQKKFAAGVTPFVCINLVMYAVGHYIEALLARQNRHPSSPPRGVPHADREVMLRKYLVARNIVAEKWADVYSELVGRRDTFIEGGVPDRRSVEEYMALAAPLIEYLGTRLSTNDDAS